jgi:hypothetical protein
LSTTTKPDGSLKIVLTVSQNPDGPHVKISKPGYLRRYIVSASYTHKKHTTGFLASLLSAEAEIPFCRFLMYYVSKVLFGALSQEVKRAISRLKSKKGIKYQSIN